MSRTRTIILTGILLFAAGLIHVLPNRDTPAQRRTAPSQLEASQAGRSHSTTTPGTTSSTLPVRRSAGDVHIAVPANWVAEPAEAGITIWRAPNRAANVTVARAAGGKQMDTRMLSTAAHELARALGNGIVEDVHMRSRRGWFIVRGTIPTGERARVTQTWSAMPSARGWVIQSWVDTSRLRLPSQLRLQEPTAHS
jgi:hypothetical protein